MQIIHKKVDKDPRKRIYDVKMGQCFWTREHGLCIRSQDVGSIIVAVNISDGCYSENKMEMLVYPVEVIAEWDDSITKAV